MSNWLDDIQNKPENLRWIEAASDRYGHAKKLLTIQIIIGVLIPIFFSIGKLFEPELSSFTALYGLFLLLLNIFLFDRIIKNTMAEGAITQEYFDCTVLNLPWNDEETTHQPSQSEVIEWSQSYRNKNNQMKSHSNWYPSVAGTIPIEYGRLVCQLCNCCWDIGLRRRYAHYLILFAMSVVFLIFGVSLYLDLSVISLILTISSLSPALIWLLRGWIKQTDILDITKKQRSRIEAIWNSTMQQVMETDDLANRARSVQNSIFRRRENGQPVFNWIYRFFRLSDEKNMIAIATSFVEEYNKNSD